MKKPILFYYPSAGKNNKYDNPYSENLKKSMSEYFRVIESNNPYVKNYRSVRLFLRAFQADVFILSWIEQIWKFKWGTFFTKAAVKLMHLRHKKVIWIYHNLQPHAGENTKSLNLKQFFLANSDFIITHSKEALAKIQPETTVPVKYLPHPIKTIVTQKWSGTPFPCDILIWGSILPYKGILEFISLDAIQNSDFKIRIIGKCKDKHLLNQIQVKCNKNIVLENRYADFDELATYIQKAKWTLFPYIGDSISSSGALIDTIAMGGRPIGPDRGAFHDLAEEGVCAVYQSHAELMTLLNSTYTITTSHRNHFIKQYSWKNFAHEIWNIINITVK